MFGKRKPSASGGQQETQALAQQREAQSAVRPASRPDASAVLERTASQGVREPARRPAEPAGRSAAAPKRDEPPVKKLLTVGRGIRLSGEITACEKLVVEGQVAADLSGAQVLEIAADGLFKGRAMVEVAEISGVFEGDLTVRRRLLLKAGGRIEGTLAYAEIEVERGGRLRGNIRQLEGQPERPGERAIAAAETNGAAPPASGGLERAENRPV